MNKMNFILSRHYTVLHFDLLFFSKGHMNNRLKKFNFKNNISLEMEKQQQTSKNQLPENIPLTYLWYGKTIPDGYLISLSDLDYPYIFIKNAKLDREFSRQIMDIQKSDYYRLQYVYQHGGIYSDIDNVVNYPCLMDLLKPYRTQDKLVFMTDQDGRITRAKINQTTNNLIFAPYPKMPLLKEMLEKVDETKQPIWGFAGLKFVGSFTEIVELNMNKCVHHVGDWSWFGASNKVLNNTLNPTSVFKSKLIKKKEIVDYQQKLKNKLNQLNEMSQKQTSDFETLKLSNQQIFNSLQELNNGLKIKNQEKQVKEQKISLQQTEQVKIKSEVSESLTEDLLDTWQGQRQILKMRINSLQDQNSHLDYERDVCNSAIGFLFLLAIAGIILHFKFFRKYIVVMAE